MWAPKQKGFTIVELLIVIVVIAILAAITIVAFNGIQNRAENTKTAQGVAQYVKLAKMYATTNGVYPTSVIPPTAPPADFWACLPYDLNTCGSNQGSSPACFGLGYTIQNVTFKNELLKIASTLPTISTQSTDCSSGYTYQGALMHIFNSGTIATIHFSQVGNVDCPSIGGASFINKAFAGNTTRCAISLPSL